MTLDDFENSLRDSLRTADLPPAPARLRAHLVDLPAREAPSRSPSKMVRTALAIGLVAVAVWLARPFSPVAVDNAPTTGAARTIPTSTDDAYTVSALLAARTAGEIDATPVLVRGYWSALLVPLSCAAPSDEPGPLELYCRDGLWGLTEDPEPMLRLVDGDSVVAKGPRITPFVPSRFEATLFGHAADPETALEVIPAILKGHFDDPAADECRPEAESACRDRFVLDDVPSFDLKSGFLPAPTPTPTPFPFDSPPEPLFDVYDCAGDVPYSLVGWTRSSALGLKEPLPEVVYAAVTRDVVLIGDWFLDPAGSGQRFRTWARSVCYAKDGASQSATVTWVPGTAYREWEDGSRSQLEP